MPVVFFSVLLFHEGQPQSYLKLLSPDGLHVALLANNKLIDEAVVGWVMLSPGELSTVLNHLCHKLVITTPLNHIIRDT